MKRTYLAKVMDYESKQFKSKRNCNTFCTGSCFERKRGDLITPLRVFGFIQESPWLQPWGVSKTTSLSSAWGRIFFPYGAYEYPNRLVSSVIISLLKGEPARCSHGNQIRDFMYVQDVADAFVALLESEVTGAVNIGSGRAITIKDVVYKIADLIGRSDLVELGAIPSAAKETPLLVADVSRLSSEVGWRQKFNMEMGLRQSITWWENQ